MFIRINLRESIKITIEKTKRKPLNIWNSFKPFLIFLLIIIVLISIALIIIALVWYYDRNNTTFLILTIVDFSVLGIFVLGFIIVGITHVVNILITKEEIRCVNCGKIIPSKIKFCPHCGTEI